MGEPPAKKHQGGQIERYLLWICDPASWLDNDRAGNDPERLTAVKWFKRTADRCERGTVGRAWGCVESGTSVRGCGANGFVGKWELVWPQRQRESCQLASEGGECGDRRRLLMRRRGIATVTAAHCTSTTGGVMVSLFLFWVQTHNRRWTDNSLSRGIQCEMGLWAKTGSSEESQVREETFCVW